MSDRVAALRQSGFWSGSSSSQNAFSSYTSFGIETVAFSGYGEFTPITVQSETVLLDANVERDKSRDHRT